MAEEEVPSSIKYKLTLSEQSSLERIFDKSEVNNYFQSLSSITNITNQMLSSHYASGILHGLTAQLQEGKLNLAKNSKPVESLLELNVLKEEEQKMLEMKAKKAFIERQLESLKAQTNTSRVTQQREEEGAVVLTREEHKALVQRIKQQREQRQRKHQEMLQAMQARSREKYQADERERQQHQQAQLQKRRQQIQRSLMQHRQTHQQQLQVERASRQKMKALSTHKFKYQQIQEQYQQQVVLRNLEEKKQKLKEIRQYRSFNLEQLNQHQRQYLQRKKLAESRQTIHQQDHPYQPPPRSQRLSSILQEQRLQRIRQQEEKKKQLNDKLARHQHYVSYLRENFVPTVDPTKRQQLEKRLQKQKREKLEVPDLKELGQAYLQEARRKGKKIEKQPRPETERNVSNPVNTTKLTIDSTGESKARAATNYNTINSQEHSEKRRRKHIEKLMRSENMDEAQKIKQLKVEAEKIGESMQRKERELKYKKDGKIKEDALQLLLSSIQAKIGIIQMYRD